MNKVPHKGDGAKLPPSADEFAALFSQLERPFDSVSVNSGYAELMARINSPAYRRRTGRG